MKRATLLGMVGGAVAFVAACSSTDPTPFHGPEVFHTDPRDAGGVVTTDDAGRLEAPPEAGASPCPSGTKLVKTLTSCLGVATTPPAAFAAALKSSVAGDVVSFAGLDEESAPCLPVVTCTPNDAATLLFSDDPESPASDGVLYADTVKPGRYRLYVYHANGGTAERKFPVVVLNQNASDATVTIRRSGVGGPSLAYVDVGKQVLADWYADAAPRVVKVPAGQRVLLDADLDSRHAGKDELVHAIYDVDVDASVKISFVSVLAAADAAQTTAGLPLLGRDGLHVRGSFPNADLLVVGRGGQQSGVQRLRLGLNEVDDDLRGIDATAGTSVALGGNYGLVYRFALGLSKPVNVAIAPRGGGWGGVGTLPSLVSLPRASEQVSSTTDAIVLGDIGKNEVSVASAGGSSLPVDLLFVTP